MKQRSPNALAKAHDLADQEIDKLSDRSATADEWQERKHRLLKGPREFRDIRGVISRKTEELTGSDGNEGPGPSGTLHKAGPVLNRCASWDGDGGGGCTCFYAEIVRRGGAIVMVRADERSEGRIRAIMDRYGPVNVSEREAQYREAGWSQFDPLS